VRQRVEKMLQQMDECCRCDGEVHDPKEVCVTERDANAARTDAVHGLRQRRGGRRARGGERHIYDQIYHLRDYPRTSSAGRPGGRKDAAVRPMEHVDSAARRGAGGAEYRDELIALRSRYDALAQHGQTEAVLAPRGSGGNADEVWKTGRQ